MPNNIEACLHLLSAIVQKYNDVDPNDMPQEVDYLQAMDLLKRINDIKTTPHGVAVAAQVQTITQVVVQWRERQTAQNSFVQVSLHGDLEMQLSGYTACPICGQLVKDKYALHRHQKRASCMRASVVLGVCSDPKQSAMMKRMNAKLLSDERGVQLPLILLHPEMADVRISPAFILALTTIFRNAQPVIRRAKDDHSVQLHRGRPFPQRLLPKMLWNSMWHPSAYFHDDAYLCPKDNSRMLMYDPSMFYGKVFPRLSMYRHTLTTFPFTLLRPACPQVFASYMLPWAYESWSDISQKMCVDVATEVVDE